MKKNLEYSKSRHIFESTNKFKVMKKLSLILGIVLCTTLSYGQDVKVGHLFIQESSNGIDTLDIPLGLTIYGKDSVVLCDNGVKTTYVIDSVVTPPKESTSVDVMFATNKSNNQQYEIRIWENEEWESKLFKYTIAFDNIKNGTFINYKVRVQD